MQIPEIVNSKISSDQELDAFVKNSVSKVSKHISANRMIFFPEYTDHDVSHFSAVLKTCLALVSDGSDKLMSSWDYGVLTVGVMLHDFGMHLTKDGFYSLTEKDSKWKPIVGFDDLNWHDLWLEFLANARRFDSKKLRLLFGDNYDPITNFPLEEEKWDEQHFLLVGEFLRTHHPRLAHEIAIHGLPAKNGSAIIICDTSSKEKTEWADIAGLVARSHGHNLREMFGYLREKYQNLVEPRHVHPIYLMVLLRVADYLQIQSSRAPTERTDTEKFASPISAQEWSLHQCIDDLTNTRDPEAVDIEASPNDVATFLRLKGWLNGLQAELDISWAILGEVYGLQVHNGLCDFSIKMRRVRSNIDQIDEFKRTIDFIPEKIGFDSVGSDLLELLVGPLYSHDAKVGLRELVQNSKDAVNELEQLISDGEISELHDRWQISSDVQVEFLKNSEEDDRTISHVAITDRGVGMTIDVVRDYYLKAGASLRNSSNWKKLHETEEGELKSQRSGRFGVGALAAFLLGEKIKVTTRHYSSSADEGLTFMAEIDTSAINVKRTTCSIGTKIEIELSTNAQQEMSKLLPGRHDPKVNFRNGLSGYFGKNPRCVYVVDGKTLKHAKNSFLPSISDDFTPPWNNFETARFHVHWTYSQKVPAVSVNQIVILNKLERYRYGNHGKYLELKCPSLAMPRLSIGDKFGDFPLNLQRNEVASDVVPFETELVRDIIDEVVCFLVNWKLHSTSFEIPDIIALRELNDTWDFQIRWLFCREGMILNLPQFLEAYSPVGAYMCYGGNIKSLEELVSNLPEGTLAGHDMDSEFNPIKLNIKGKVRSIIEGKGPATFENRIASFNIFTPKKIVDEIKGTMKPGRELSKVLDSLWYAPNSEIKTIVSGELDQFEQLAPHIERSLTMKDGLSIWAAYQLEYVPTKNHSRKTSDANNPIFDRWMELLDLPYLPNSKDELLSLSSRLEKKLGAKFNYLKKQFNETAKSKNAK